MKISTAFLTNRRQSDPSLIETPAQWYLLMHISSSLIQFDFNKNIFKPLLASRWEIEDNVFRFYLSDDARFNDGSSITAIDVAASIKRILFLKTSTHFKIWEYLVESDKLISPSSDCRGIKVLSERSIEFRLKCRVDSFFIFLASPEAGIWPARNIDANTAALDQKVFSGPYQVDSSDIEPLELSKNRFSSILKHFPKAPEQIEIYTKGQPIDLFKAGKIDLQMEMTRPFLETEYLKMGLNRKVSPFNSLLYLFKIDGSSAYIDPQFLVELWKKDLGNELTPAETFLPFASLGAINRERFLRSLKRKTYSKSVKVATASPFFSSQLVDLLNVAAKDSNSNIHFEQVSVEKIFALFAKGALNSERYDFVLGPYVASERYPSVQLTFLLEWRECPLELDLIDNLDLNESRSAQIQALQEWMLKEQFVVPLLFVRNHIVSRPNVQIGDQPLNDSEIHLWKVSKA